MQDEDTIEGGRALARERGPDLAAFYDRRAAAALAYCSRLCTPAAIADAVEASFARVFEAAATGAAPDEDALDRQLRSAVRSEAAARASAATAGVPARRLLERLADPARGGACELMPALLAARADGVLSGRDREQLQAHLRRCAECRTAELRFNEAEHAFDALAGDDAPALGRSLLAELFESGPLSDRRRFAREQLSVDEPPEWIEDIDWEEEPAAPRVVPVPGDALGELTEEPHQHEHEHEHEHEGEGPVVGEGAHEHEHEHEGQGSFVADDSFEFEPVGGPAPAPAGRSRSPVDAEQRVRAMLAAQRDPAVTGAATADFPALTRARLRAPHLGARGRRRLAVALLVLGTLLFGEAGATVLWKEPFTALLASRAQDDLSDQLHKLDSKPVSGPDAQKLAATRGERARMAVLARREDAAVPAGDALGLVRIDKLDAEYVVVQSTEADALRKGPGHYTETPLPGQGGTVGIAGHRTTYAAPFRHIDELKAGDTVSVKMPYGLFTYAVDRQRIVPADFKGAFASGDGEPPGSAPPPVQRGGGGSEFLVLSACHPLYSASERILVYAHLVSARPLGAAVDSTPAAPDAPSKREIAKRRTAVRLKALGARTLAAGMTGPDVKELQRLLGLPATGTFGPETTAAVQEFQRTHALPVVGQAGSQTKAALARRPHPPARPPTPPDVPPQQQPNGQQPYSGQTGTQPYSGQTGTQPYSGPTGAQPQTGGSGGRQTPSGTGQR